MATRTAEVTAAAGDVDQALGLLRQVVREARELGFVDLELAAGLTLGRLEREAGKTAEGEARLEEVARKAGERGYELIAGKAVAALGS